MVGDTALGFAREHIPLSGVEAVDMPPTFCVALQKCLHQPHSSWCTASYKIQNRNNESVCQNLVGIHFFFKYNNWIDSGDDFLSPDTQGY